MGVFLLTGTALRSQTRTTQHVARMNELAAASASLSLAADAERSRAVELQVKSAADADAGLARQSEAAALEAAADRDEARAAAATARGDELQGRAEALREEGARDASESEALLGDAEGLRVRSGRLRSRAERDRAAAASDEERAVALSEEAARSSELAAEAEEKAAGYEALAMKREGQSAKDGEALLRTETGAMEDAEVMATCTPIPLLDFFCDGIGAIIESGYQGMAALAGAKAAVESISAVAAQSKERAQMALAIEKEEEAARLAAEAGEFQGLADEESGNAALEEAEGRAAGADAEKDQLLGEEKSDASDGEEALAAVDEEKAAEEYAEAARDESIALEEESSAIANQIESEKLLEESTSEEFESLNERFAGELKETKAENMMKESIGHGVHALGFALYSIITAGLVVYVVLMRGLAKIIVPGVTRILRSESTLSAAKVVDRWCRFILHVGVVMATIASMPSLLLNFENMPVPMRARAILTLSLVAGVIESLGFHTTHALCRCQAKGSDFASALSTAVLAFLSNVCHLVPVVLMELLVIATIFGPGVFSKTNFHINPVWMWCTLLLLVYTFIRAVETKSDPNQLPIDNGEQGSLCASFGRKSYPPRDIAKEYGSMEDVSLLSSSISSGSVRCDARASSRSTSTLKYHEQHVFDRCSKALHQYCERLRPLSDILVLSLVAMLLWHCWPLLRILYPLAKASLGRMVSWISLPILLIVVAIAAVVVHFVFVH